MADVKLKSIKINKFPNLNRIKKISITNKNFHIIKECSLIKDLHGKIKPYYKRKQFRRTADGHSKMTSAEFIEFIENIEKQSEFEKAYLNSEQDQFGSKLQNVYAEGLSVFGLTYNGGEVKDASKFKVETGHISDLAKVKI